MSASLILCTHFSLLPHPYSHPLSAECKIRHGLPWSCSTKMFSVPSAPVELQPWCAYTMQSGRDGWSMEKKRRRQRVDWRGMELMWGGWRGRVYADSREGGDRVRWRLCSSTDVWTVGGQGRWVVALKCVLTESFLTWRFTQALSKGGGTRVNDPFPLVMNIYLARAFTGCCVEWQMVVNHLYSIPIYSLTLFHLWLTHLI